MKKFIEVLLTHRTQIAISKEKELLASALHILIASVENVLRFFN